MVREDILGGLELAMSRGETLEQAMYSFFNAGYKKEDIEEAARVLVQQNPQAQNQQPQQNIPSQQSQVNQPPEQDNQSQNIPQQSFQQDMQPEQTPPETSQQIQPKPLPLQQQFPEQPKMKKGFFGKLFGKLFSGKQKTNEPVQKNQPMPEQKPREKQKPSGISEYGEQPRKKPGRNMKRIVILSILVSILLILLGSLVAIFIFRDSIVDFLNSILS